MRYCDKEMTTIIIIIIIIVTSFITQSPVLKIMQR